MGERQVPILTLAAVLIAASSAIARASSPLPVIFELDDPGDGRYEEATVELYEIHREIGIPYVQATVPCRPGSVPGNCRGGTFHREFVRWEREWPDGFEVAVHGFDHRERLGTLSEKEQHRRMKSALQVVSSWGLPNGKPVTFVAPFASANEATWRVARDLGFRVFVRNSGRCHAAPGIETFCNSVPICRPKLGRRQTGSSCEIRPAEEVLGESLRRRISGRVFLVYHVQDVLTPDERSIDPEKLAAVRSILERFAKAADEGDVRPMTMRGWLQTKASSPAGP